jgi:hypothetical protein
MSSGITYREMSAMFDKHEEAHKMLVEFFGTDDKGRINLVLFLRTQVAQLEARVGPYAPPDDRL